MAVLLGLLIVACDDGGGVRPVPTTDTVPGTDATVTPPGEATADELPTPTEDGTPSPDATPSADTACTKEETLTPVIAACEALAELFGRGLGEIDTESVTPREWPDACLGLAESDELCAQVITPGHEVVLELVEEGSLFTYRTDDATHTRLQEFDLLPD